MKVIIAGSRTINDFNLVKDQIELFIEIHGEIAEVVCGCAKGVDTHGADWAHFNKIKTTYFPANWKKHGKAAGHIRNRKMAKYANALILIWDGESRGSKNMLSNANKFGLNPIWVKEIS